MPITSLNDLNQFHDSLEGSDLPLVIHGPIEADITLACYGKIAASVVEAAQFLNSLYDSITVNVLQIKQLDPLPASDLKSIFQVTKYLLLIETDVEHDLYRLISKQVGIKISHHHYFSPNQPQLTAKIIALVKNTFIITK